MNPPATAGIWDEDKLKALADAAPELTGPRRTVVAPRSGGKSRAVIEAMRDLQQIEKEQEPVITQGGFGDYFNLRFLATLTMRQPNIYAGTVPHKEKLRRRAKNKVARASRRANR